MNLKNTDLCKRCSKGLKDRDKCFGVLMNQCFSNIRLFLPAVLSFKFSTATGKKNLFAFSPVYHMAFTCIKMQQKCHRGIIPLAAPPLLIFDLCRKWIPGTLLPDK